ncbi:MAG: BCCT family transporter [Treponema sp.]
MKKNTTIDYSLIFIPLVAIILISASLFLYPQSSKNVIDYLWNVMVNKLGFFYMLLGFSLVIIALYLAFSKYGKIKLGNLEKPRYSNFSWGAMIFTSTMAADILYWSLIEWAYYYNSTPFAKTNLTLAERQDWAATYPLFHWGITPWAFYMVPAVAFGYMLYVRKAKTKRISESCRSILKCHTDGIAGKAIDIFSIIGLLAGTATTFSLATPLLSLCVSNLFGITPSTTLTIVILLVIALIYTLAVLFGFKGISHLANIAVASFVVLLVLVFLASNKVFMIENAITGIGKMLHNFIPMSTWMDPLRLSGDGNAGFPQNWTIFYWAYWIAWFVATPFFIGTISEGRTIKNTVLGGILCGILGTYLSFIILGYFGLNLETQGIYSSASALSNGDEPSLVIIEILKNIPYSKVVLAVLCFTMIAFYSSTFDAITLIISFYCQKNTEEMPKKSLRAFWSIVFIILPIALILIKCNLSQLQSLSILAAFPLGYIIILITVSFFKNAKESLK